MYLLLIYSILSDRINDIYTKHQNAHNNIESITDTQNEHVVLLCHGVTNSKATMSNLNSALLENKQ